MKNLKNLLFETLSLLGGKKKKNSVNFLKPRLHIKHKDVGIKYTIQKVGMYNGEICVYAYRYIKPKSNKKMYIKIFKNDFDKYEPV